MIQDEAEIFLDDCDARFIPLVSPQGTPASLTTDRVLFGKGDSALEVVVAWSAVGQPRIDDVRRLWKARHANRSAPVLLVVLYADAGNSKAVVCGTQGDPSAVPGLEISQLERVCSAALREPDRHAAHRALERLLVGVKDKLSSGLNNQGLFATHELRMGVPHRSDWQTACTSARPLLGLSGLALVQSLGYTATPRGSAALLLTHQDKLRAVAVLLDAREVFDRPSARFGAVSPVAHAIAIAARENVPWVIVTRGSQIRLHPVQPTVGIGRKSQGETYVELDLGLLTDDTAGYLSLLLAPSALASGGSVDQILAASTDFAADLGTRLRDRIYREVVPELSVAVARHMGVATDGALQEAYHRTLVVLFRLLFLAYAEDRKLLPYGRNARYDRHAVKTLAKDLTADPERTFDPKGTALWDDMLTVWAAVDGGNPDWDVPPYNGGLFTHDPVVSPSGAALADMHLTDAEFGPALRALLVDVGPDGTRGPVDFRSLSVREFGTIYEGLLESSLSIAPIPLTINKDGSFVPAREGEDATVSVGQVYFHNNAGNRKATGSYFTKSFAVEHLLDTALEPALLAHLGRVGALLDAEDEAGAADAFFDFRIVDLAMGSGHFLVAAIDRIETRFTAFLAEHPISAVADELTRLSQAAREALGDQGVAIEIETSALLRRQIARRCVYGLDLNLIAVELARLGIWIHTFVPGLPMSSLEHGLIVGDSLTGIGTLSEAMEVLEPRAVFGQMSLFAETVEDALHTAGDLLHRVARTDEAKKAEVQDAARAYRRALADAQDAKHIFDAAVAVRLGLIRLPDDAEKAIGAIVGDDELARHVRQELERFGVTHLPYQFPEVFVRSRPGFDVILGNPPWEKVRWEAAPFWADVYPGLMALRDKKRDDKIDELRAMHPVEAAEEQRQISHRGVLQELFKKAYTLRGGTHLELAQLMLERAVRLRRDSGHLGLVLPRQSLVLAGWKKLREELTTRHSLRIVQGRNHGEWIFEDVHASYAVVLLTAMPATTPITRVWVANNVAEVTAAVDETAIVLSQEDLASFSESHVIPWFASSADRTVFDTMRNGPRLASGKGWIKATHDARWDFRGSGPDKGLAVRSRAEDCWSVLMTAHVDQFSFDQSAIFKQFVTDRDGLIAKRRGVVERDGVVVLSDRHPMIIVRHPSRSDDSRTLIATALPEAGILHNKGYIHAVMHDLDGGTGELARLALLGLLNTITVDWWVRRFVDRHVTAPVINQIPLPSWTPAQVGEAAQITSSLLARHGYSRLAGGIEVTDACMEDDTALLTRLERLALHGYGLEQDALELMAADFNAIGLPIDLREALGIGHVPPKTNK
ncbi:Eco57I restriction-modification methylase domain-containing protein [Streptomyces sp. NPDC058228]|uniref:Eco57I restriction-modification methylase domain-containing protein n=1 Tax=Streptomyces sp. NPDC058228 TaxID=3346390 RepID=UPI0036E28F1B